MTEAEWFKATAEALKGWSFAAGVGVGALLWIAVALWRIGTALMRP